MSGYFDDILDAYAPPAPAIVDAPWSDPFEVEATLPESPPGDPPVADSPAPDPARTPAPAPLIEAEPRDATPAPDTGEMAVPSPEPGRPTDRIIERELRVVEEPRDSADPILPEAAPDVIQASSEIHEHTHIDEQITQRHDHLHIVEAKDFEPDAPAALPTPDAPAPPARDEPPVRRELAALEAELAAALARLHGDEAPDLAIISPEDFEPEAADVPSPPALDPVREVTREIVTEHHHHHSTETRIEPPPRPPPRTAAEASRIGPIRFSGDWKTGGG